MTKLGNVYEVVVTPAAEFHITEEGTRSRTFLVAARSLYEARARVESLYSEPRVSIRSASVRMLEPSYLETLCLATLASLASDGIAQLRWARMSR